MDNSWLADTIAGLTFIILCATLGLPILDARVATNTVKMVGSLNQANDELQRSRFDAQSGVGIDPF